MPMRAKLYAGGIVLSLALSAAGSGQTPLGKELRVNDQGKNPQGDQVVAVARGGEILVAWQGLTEDESRDGLWTQWYSPAGQLIGHNRALQLSPSQIFDPALGPGMGGGVTVFWRKSFIEYQLDTLHSRELSPGGTWLSPQHYLTTLGLLAPRFIRARPQGGNVVGLIGFPRRRIEARSYLLFTDAAGQGTRGPQLIHPSRLSDQYLDGLAMSPSGEFLVAWTDVGARARVLAQVFSANGRPLRGPVQVHNDVPGRQSVGRVAALGNKGYVVVWDDEDPVTGRVDLRMRFLNPDGTPRGPVRRVDDEVRHRFVGGDLAVDAAGNFFVVWEQGGPAGTFGRGSDAWGRLFRPDGTPVGPKQVLNTYTLDDQTEPIVATGANGTFVVFWQSYGQDGDAEGIFGQIFAASPADEVCALGAKRLRCDLARSGGPAELTISLPGNAEWVAGDWDGDGRDDLCHFAAGTWGCDIDHFGAPDEATLTFGQSGDHPLLGDVDGDGKTDACVQRVTQLLCDTARDGGQAEVTLEQGQLGDQLVLADVNGDRRAEACTVRGASFLCDTGHDGGVFEWERSFGSGSGTAIFGDADGDGRDEPCVLNNSELSCDTAHAGGPAATRLAFPLEAGEHLMLANLDGL